MGEQISLFDIISPEGGEDSENSSILSLATSKVSCCSRYRQCSDAGRCLIAGTDISDDCRYRLKLEAGEIFYGRRAKYFSQPDFDYCLGQFEAMSEAEREAFLSCLYHFCDLCFSTCFTSRSAALEALAARGLIKLYPFPLEMVRRMNIYKGMYPLLGKIGAKGEWLEWEKTVKAEGGGECGRAELCADFLLENYRAEVEMYLSNYCAIDITSTMRLKFADEFYAEYGASMRAQLHDLPDPLLADIRFKRGGIAK